LSHFLMIKGIDIVAVQHDVIVEFRRHLRRCRCHKPRVIDVNYFCRGKSETSVSRSGNDVTIYCESWNRAIGDGEPAITRARAPRHWRPFPSANCGRQCDTRSQSCRPIPSRS
jgi:hypothetical protein